MSEETKQPAEETPEEPQEAPQEEAPPAEEKVPDEKAEKAARGKKKKEKTYTLTREQMEAAELAARQLESVKDQFVRLTAEYDNYRTAWRLCNPVNASVFAILSSWKLFFRSCRNASEFALFCKDSFLRSVMSR